MKILLIALILILAAACEEEKITVASEPKHDAKLVFDVPDDPEKIKKIPEIPKENITPGKITIVLQKDVGADVWYFKLTGDGSLLKTQQFSAFQSFIDSLNVENGEVTWAIPDGWKLLKENQGILRAEIQAGANAAMKISKLGSMAKGNLKNVNRWRRQLGLAPVTEENLPGVSIISKIPGRPETMFIVGTPDIMKRLLGTVEPEPQKPDEPPEAVDGYKKAPSGSEVDYKVPGHWGFGETSSFRKATFLLKDDGKEATITVIPLGKGSGSLLENVNRWRSQISLPAIDQQQLEKDISKVTVDGQPGVTVKFSKDSEGIAGAIVDKGDRTWFIKLFGDSAVIDKEYANFLEFLKTVKFK